MNSTDMALNAETSNWSLGHMGTQAAERTRVGTEADPRMDVLWVRNYDIYL